MIWLAAAALAAAPARPISEYGAVDLVFKAIEQRYPTESIRCFSLLTEERSRTAFEIAVYEKHDRRCGGDPEVMHVRDRFRVGRSPLRLWVSDLEGNFRACRLLPGRRPQCPPRN
jgi:hypothetical protein